MISKKLIINEVEYTVSATTIRGLTEIEGYLRNELKEFKVALKQHEVPNELAIESLVETPKPKRTRKKS